MNHQDFITIESDKRGGKPCIRGLQIDQEDSGNYNFENQREQSALLEWCEENEIDIMG